MKGLSLIFIIFAVFIGHSVLAQGFMMYGTTREDAARAGTGTGWTDPLSAAYRNPAFLVTNHTEISLGGMMVVDSSKVNSNRRTAYSSIEELAFASPLPIFGLKNRLFIGLALQTPGTKVYSINAMPVTQPQFLFLRPSVRRLDLAVSMAVRILDNLSIGAGFTVLPQVDGKVTVDFTTSGQASATQVDVRLRFAPVVGIAYQPTKFLSLGLAYRGGNRTPLSIPVTVRVSDQIPDIFARIDAQELYAPHVISAGAAFHFGKVRLAADLNYLLYSSLAQPSPNVFLMDSSGKVTKASVTPSPMPRNVFNPSVAFTYMPTNYVSLTTGYSFMPSVLDEQTGRTNLLDCPKHTITIGAGLDLYKLAHLPMGVDFSTSFTVYAGQIDAKAKLMPQNPGYPSISYNGFSATVGLSLWVRFQ